MLPQKSALEFKGRMLSATRVRLLSSDPGAIRAQLAERRAQMPHAFNGMPAILESAEPVELVPVLQALREAGVQPMAVMDGALAEAARAIGLAVLPADAVEGERPAHGNGKTKRRGARILDRPVRSGQQVYAEGADLIVMSAVSPGAELLADGCIHVYGVLRGRAIAGAQGDVGARVFCRRFEAELVAVAGVYAVAEQTQGELRGKPVQILLAEGKLKLERLNW